MTGRDLQVLSAVAILAGTLVMGLNEVPTPGLALMDSSGSPSENHDAFNRIPSGIPPIDARDNNRMDNRQRSGWQPSDVSQGRPAGSITSQGGPIESDGRRDNSRLDNRYDAGFVAPASSSPNSGR